MDRLRATTKLNAILSKDAKQIFEDKIWLPNIGIPTSEQQVKDWLKVRSDVLQEALAAKTDAEISTKLSTATSIFAKNPDDYKTNNGLDASELTAKEFDDLCKIRLYKFALGE